MNDSTILLSETEFSKKFGIPVKTIRCYRASGKGPAFIKLGARCRYREKDILDWIEQNKRTNTKRANSQMNTLSKEEAMKLIGGYIEAIKEVLETQFRGAK